MKINRFKIYSVAVLGFATMLPNLSASIIGPGVIGTADIFTTQTGYTQLANTGLVNVNPVPGTSFNANYVEYVGYDANNNLCGVAGKCITFLIDLVSNTGPGVIERISTASFGSFITDVGYNTDTAFSGVLPVTVDRSANGNVVGFNFNTGSSNINTGQRAERLEIMTNATAFTTGTVSIQDGVAGFGAGFAPTVASTPEPASMLLLGAGLIGLGASKKLFGRA